jgi:hypothetical protein
LALNGSRWSASYSGHFTPGKRAFSAHWIGSWVGPRVGLGRCGEEKILPLPGFELGLSGKQPMATLKELSQLLHITYFSFKTKHKHVLFSCHWMVM